jgi:Fe-S-cluster-containing dehydrogenase component
MAKRLFIDLEKCRNCKVCKVPCSYFYHPYDDGILYLRELAEFAVTCRRCELAPCAESCPTDALEKTRDGVMQRHNMRCVGCRTCCYACPFGVILPDVIPYAVSRCDFCIGRLGEDEVPVCVGGCAEGAIAYGEFEPDSKENIFVVGHHLSVHAVPWKKEETV